MIYSASFNSLKNSGGEDAHTHTNEYEDPHVYAHAHTTDEDVVEETHIHFGGRIHYDPPVSPSGLS